MARRPHKIQAVNQEETREGCVSNLLMQGVGMTSQRTRERLIQRLVDQGVSNLRVLDIIRNTPRHLFLDEALAHRAYEDTALPIGYGQTLSQPYIVARMTEILLGAAGKLNRVLEVGTGSGYQTCILAQLVPQRSEEHTSELQSRENLVCRLLLEKKNYTAGPRSRDWIPITIRKKH